MADQTACSACRSAPKLRGRKCAFRGPKFSADNWMCETLGLLRDAAIFRNRDDLHSGSVAVVLLPDVDVLQGYIVLTYYKDRGSVDGAILAHDGSHEILARGTAEAAVAALARVSAGVVLVQCGHCRGDGRVEAPGLSAVLGAVREEEWLSTLALATRLGLGATNMANRLAELRSLGLVERRGAGARHSPYLWRRLP